MSISENEIKQQYGFSNDNKKDQNACIECVYLEGLTLETKKKICKICDDFKVVGVEHVLKYEDIKYTGIEIIKMLLDF